MSPLRQSAASPSSSRLTMGAWNRALVIVLGILLVSWGGPAASAFWSSVNSGFGASKADAVAQGAKPTTSVSGTSVTVSWAASTTTAGRSVTGYSIARYASATGGTKVTATGTCSGTITALSCVEGNVPAGTWFYSVTPLLSLWQGAESARSTGATPVTDTTPPPAPGVTAPAYVYQSNVGNVIVTGTAEALSSVALTVTGTGAQPISQTVNADASGDWTAGPLNLSAFSPGTITYSARATDAAGNTGQPGTASSIKDVSSPTVTGVQLNNGPGSNKVGKIEPLDSLTLTLSEPLSAKTICSAWTDDAVTQTQNADNQVTVSISPTTNVLTVASTGCPVLRIGTVALGGTYNSSSTTTLTYKGTSSLQWNPTAKTLTITLGTTVSGSPNQGTQSAAAASYTPASGLTDVAGNPLATTAVQGTASRF